MSKAAQLKRKAAELEQKRQYDRALATYVQAIDAASGTWSVRRSRIACPVNVSSNGM